MFSGCQALCCRDVVYRQRELKEDVVFASTYVRSSDGRLGGKRPLHLFWVSHTERYKNPYNVDELFLVTTYVSKLV